MDLLSRGLHSKWRFGSSHRFDDEVPYEGMAAVGDISFDLAAMMKRKTR